MQTDACSSMGAGMHPVNSQRGSTFQGRNARESHDRNWIMSESKIKAARLKFMKRAPSNLHESSSDKVLNLNCQRKGIPISVPKEGYDDNDDSEHSRFKREIDQSFPPLALPTRQTGNILTKKFPPSSGYSNGASNLKLEENPMAAGCSSSSFPSSRLVKPTIHHSSRSHGSLGPQSRPWTSSIPPVEQSPPNSSTQNSHLSSRLGSEHLSVNDGRSTAISSPHQEKSVIETSTWAEEDQSLILRLDAATASPTRDERPAQRGDIADLNLTQRDHAAIACPPRGKATVQKQPPKKKPSLFLNSSSSRGRINPIRQDQTSKNTNSRLISPRKSISQRASNGEVPIVLIPKMVNDRPAPNRANPALQSQSTSPTHKHQSSVTSIFSLRNEFNRFPEVRPNCQSPDQSFDYSLDTPDIDPNSICPFCDELLPKKPSKKLKDLIQHLIKRSHAEKRPTPQNPRGISLPFFETASCCKMHSDERDLIPFGLSKGWPTKIDFSKLPKRIKSYRSGLNEIINGTKKSKFLDQAMETWSVQGAVRIRNVVNEFDSFEVEQPGYYGYRGHELIYNTLSRLFRLEQSDTEPLSPDYLIRRVLLPEVSLRLIAEDLGLPHDDSRVMETLEESRSFGSALFPMEESYLESESGSGSDDDDDVPIKSRTRSPRKKVDSQLIKQRRSDLRDDDNSDVQIVSADKKNKDKTKGKGSKKKAWVEDDIDSPKKITEKNQKISHEKAGSKGENKSDNEVGKVDKRDRRLNRVEQTKEPLLVDDQVPSSSSDDVTIQIERKKGSGQAKKNKIVYVDDDKDGSTEEDYSQSNRLKTKLKDTHLNSKAVEKTTLDHKKRKKIHGSDPSLKKKRKVSPDSEESEDELNVIKRSNSLSVCGSSQQPFDTQLRSNQNLTVQKKTNIQASIEINSKEKKKKVIECEDDEEDEDEIDYERNRSLEAISSHCSQKDQNTNKLFETVELEEENEEIKPKKKTPEEILKSCKIKKIDKTQSRGPSIEHINSKKPDTIVQKSNYRKNLNQPSLKSIVGSGSKEILPVAHPTRKFQNPNPNRSKKTLSNQSVRNSSTRDDPGWRTQI